jgi:hypothetical protein
VSCSVVVTSRRRLRGVEGARWLTLGELPLLEAVQMLARADGRFAGQPYEAGRVATSCGRLPSALRLAATRWAAEPSWPPSRLAQLLSEERGRLDALGDRDLRTAPRLGGQDLVVVAGADGAGRIRYRLPTWSGSPRTSWPSRAGSWPRASPPDPQGG